MRKIITSSALLVLVMGSVAGLTAAYFSDNETSNGNTYSAGTLDLNVDGGNTNVVKFTVANMKPGDQPKGTFTLKNVGTVNGYLDLENVAVTSTENGCVEPETEAGDTTCGNPGPNEGELQDVVNLRLFLDNNCDGWIGTGETVFFNGKTGTVPGNVELNQALNSGATQCVTAIHDWWSTADDNKAQNDSMTLDMTFELGQTTGQ